MALKDCHEHRLCIKNCQLSVMYKYLKDKIWGRTRIISIANSPLSLKRDCCSVTKSRLTL